MRLNLDTLRAEIQEHLETRGLVVFQSFPRTAADLGAGVYWDTEQHPDYRDFVSAAEAAGARLVTLYAPRVQCGDGGGCAGPARRRENGS